MCQIHTGERGMDNYLNGIKSISDYNADKTLIAELEREIERLKLVNRKLSTANSGLKIQLAKKAHIKNWSDRSHKAKLMIREFKGSMKDVDLIRRIAKDCFLSESAVNKLVYP